MSVEVKMSHNEKEDSSDIRFILSGGEREMEGVLWGMIFGAGQSPAARSECLTKHLKDLQEKEKEAKARAKAEAKAERSG